MPNELAIETRELTKRYRRVEAVRDVSLNVPRGSICGFLGRNGAGKTTVLKMLIGMARPTGGEGFVFGYKIDVPEQSVEIRRRVGYVAEEKSLFPHMTVAQAITLTSGFFPQWDSGLARHCLDIFGLAPALRIASLSRGMRSRLLLLLALARRPELLLLDEPTDGLDPEAIEHVLKMIVGVVADSGATVLLSSHRLAEIEQIADRIVVLHHGRIVLDEATEELQTRYKRLHLVFEGAVPEAALPIARANGGASEGRTLSMLVRRDLEPVLAQARGLQPQSLEVLPVSLKEIFLDVSQSGDV